MKKLIAVLAVLLLVAPAMAADWSFYASQRIATWYVDRDYGNAPVNNQDDDQATQWYFQGNSRLGAKVKADKVTGRIELALGPNSSRSNGDGADTNVQTRLAYGQWKFTENAWLKVGKDYSPVTDLISTQYFNADNTLKGEGNFYGRRPAGLTLGIGDFELAFLTPSYGADVGTTATGINGATGGDADSYFPRLEASYRLTLASAYIKPFGGVQYYTVEETGLGNVTGDIDVWSWVLGVSTKWDIGAFSIGSNISYGLNEGAVTSWQTGSNARASSLPTLSGGGDDVDDVETLQAMLVASLRFSDTLRFEASAGYRMDDPDGAGLEKDKMWVAYLQAMITLAPGVYFGPEVGYYDYMDNTAGTDEGNQWYAGAKWQIDF